VEAPPTTTVVVGPWTANEHGATAGIKTISYASNVRLLAYAEQHGATEALFANTQGMLCEATGSNVFAVFNGRLCTPPATSGCLLGVTRGLILELAASLDLPYAEVDIPIAEVINASEVFLSSTMREVQAVTHIDGVALAQAPGSFAVRLARAYTRLVDTTSEP